MKKIVERDEKSFGFKMQQIREVRKISLSRLASETGLSQRYLKEIEEGIVNPPVAAVIRVAKALAIESGTFLSSEDKKASARRRADRYFKRTQNYSYQTLTPDAEKWHMKAFLVTIEPKQEHKMVDYRHEGEEFDYILEGEVEVIVGDQRHLLRKGQSLHFNSGLTHKLRNVSDGETKLLVTIYTP
jgi:electron transfer flavoprotein alpha subunit